MASSGGKYISEVLNGRVQLLSTAAAGVALPIATGTGITFGVWNTNPNMNAVLLKLSGGYTSGTIALGTLGISTQYVGFATGTGAPLSAWTAATPGTNLKNALTGAGQAATMAYTASAGTLTTGGTATLWTGPSIESASAGTGLFGLNLDYDGMLGISPGYVAFVCSSVAQTALFSLTLAVAEVPIAS